MIHKAVRDVQIHFGLYKSISRGTHPKFYSHTPLSLSSSITPKLISQKLLYYIFRRFFPSSIPFQV